MSTLPELLKDAANPTACVFHMLFKLVGLFLYLFLGLLSGDITLKLLHRRRGKEAINHFDIIPRYGGAIIHDCWASYLAFDHCGHGLCGSHLLRELVFVIDSNNYRWAANMKRLLQETCKRVSASDKNH